MRNLVVTEFLTLDGVMQSLGSPDEDRDGGFEHGGWSQPYGDEVLGQEAGKGMADTTAYLFGRRTYQHMAAHWPNVGDDDPIAAHLNRTAKYVVSRTLDDPSWEGTTVLRNAAEVADLKTTGEGNIVVLGSGVLTRSLIERGLVDRFSVFVHPIVLGTGKQLFREVAGPVRLEMVSCTPTTTGVLLCDYRVVD